MKIRKILILLIMLMFLSFNFVAVFADNDEPDIDVKAAVLLDNKTKKILYSKDADKKLYPASTTKILTAIISLEECNLDDVVTASYDAVTSIPEGYETANIQIGEELTVEQLLQLLLVHSANDAANILAEHVGGSVDSFSSIMNTKANELGLTNSHFTNAYGRHDENHYTTAMDLSKILQYCMKNESFRKIAGSASCTIPPTNKSGARTYSSTNELIISTTKIYYKYLTLGKTGYTSQAKGCLVSAAYRDDLELVCVVLGSDNRFTDTKKLYEYGYNNYSVKTIANQNDIADHIVVSRGSNDTKNLDLLVNDNISALLKKSELNNTFSPEITLNENISAPIEEGTVLGKIKYTIDDIEYTSDLTASHSVKESFLSIYGKYIIIFVILFGLVLLLKKKKIQENIINVIDIR